MQDIVPRIEPIYEDEEEPMMSKPHRATAIVLNSNGEALLVREKGSQCFSLPGGGIHGNQPGISVAGQGVYEQTGVVIHTIEWILDHESDTSHHMVFLAQGNEEPGMGSDSAEIKWWDMYSPAPVIPSAREILQLSGVSKGRGLAA